MRKILFRGQKIGSKEWVYGDLEHKIYTDFINYKVDGYSVIPETVGQFTGLTDKNGTKIFECDILKMQNVGWKYTLVKFHSGGFCFYTTETSYLRPIVPCYWKEGEVVGNIHDNHELLESSF